jgi:hypothetical protein
LIFILALASFDITILFYIKITNLVLNSQYQFIQINRCLSVVRKQKEGSFGCEVIARTLRQLPIKIGMPECGWVSKFFFVFMQQINHCRCRFYSLRLTPKYTQFLI